MIASLSTYLPPWGTTTKRVPGLDEDAVTLAVSAGRHALEAAAGTIVTSVVLVTRDPALLEGGSAAVLLAGLGLPSSLRVSERLGGAPASLDSLAEAAAASVPTLVIGVDLEPAGAAAAVIRPGSGPTPVVHRVNRSLPMRTRTTDGAVREYEDPRLQRERGMLRSVELADLPSKAVAVAGVSAREAASFCQGTPPILPTLGASSPLFAVAALAGSPGGLVVAIEQASLTALEIDSSAITVVAVAPAPGPAPRPGAPGPDIKLSLPAYERAFDAKVGLMAAKCRRCGTLALPQRFRCLNCGSEEPSDLVGMPREAEVYSVVTIHVPVPGLVTPYSLAVVELGDTGVRILAQVTGAPAGSVAIGDRGSLVLRRVALRTGVPDYGYAFAPAKDWEVAA